jgi:methionine-rich copper-binding protein CopC
MKLPALVAFALASVLSTGAWAHAHLKEQSPAENSTGAAPAQVRLAFSEGIELAFSEVTLAGADGQTVQTRLSLADNAPATLVATPVAALGAGTWKVQWKVVSVDTHRSQGQYSFTVR